jgi:hypothetical protein
MANQKVRGVSWVLIASMLHLTACSAFLPEKQEVSITASQPGMEIYVNNEDVGPSPAKADLNRDQPIEVSDGIKTVQIGRKVSLTGALDIAGTILFLFPLIGCFTPGFWTLDDTDIHLAKYHNNEGAEPTDSPPPVYIPPPMPPQ